MDISKKKKTAIILGAGVAIFAASATATGIIYSRKNVIPNPTPHSNILDKGISQDDSINQKPSTWDSKTDKKFKYILEYTNALIQALNQGTKNVSKNLSIDDYKKQIETLKKNIERSKNLKPILDESINNLGKYQDKQKQLSDAKEKLKKSTREAEEALARAQAKLDGLLKNKDKVRSRINEIIALINKTLEDSSKASITPEFDYFINKLKDLKEIANGYKQDAKNHNLSDEISKLDNAIAKINTEIARLEELKSKQNDEQQKEALKDYANRFAEKVDKAIEKANQEESLEDINKNLAEYESLRKEAEEAKKLAERLHVDEAKTKLQESLDKLAQAKTQLEAKKVQKENEINQLKQEISEAIQKLNAAILEGKAARDSNKFDDLNNAITSLTNAITKGNEVLEKAKTAKLDDEASELEQKIEEAKAILELVKQQKIEVETQINDAKQRLAKQKQDLDALVEETKNATTIVPLKEALKKLAQEIEKSNALVENYDNFSQKEKIQVEVEALKQSIAKANEEKTSSQRRLEELEQAHNALIQEVNEALQQADAAISEAKDNKESDDKAKLQEIITKLTESQTKLNEVKTKAAVDPTLTQKINDKLSEVSTWLDTINTQKQKVELKEAKIAELKTKITEQIQNLDTKKQELETALATNNKDTISTAIENYKKAIEKADELYEKVKDEPKLAPEANNFKSKIDDAKTKLEEAKAKLQDLEQKETKAREAIIKAKEDLKKATEKVDEALNGEDLEKLKDAKKDLDKAIEDAKEAAKQAGEANLNDAKQELEQKIEEAENKQSTLKDKIDEVEQKNLDALKTKINEQTTKLSTAITKIDDALTKTHNLEKVKEILLEVNPIIENANTFKTQIEENKAKYQVEYDAFDSKLTEANNKKQQLEQLKTQIEQERATANANFETAKTLAEAAMKKFDDHQSTIAEVKSAIVDIKKAIEKVIASENEAKGIEYTELENKAKALKQELNTKLAAANQRLQALKNEEEQERQRIAQLKLELDQAKANLQNKLNDVNNANTLDEKQTTLDALKVVIDTATTLNQKIVDQHDETKTNPNYQQFKMVFDNAKSTYDSKLAQLKLDKKEIEDKVSALETKITTASTKADNAISSKEKPKLTESLNELKAILEELKTFKQEVTAKGYQTQLDKLTQLQQTLQGKIDVVDHELNEENNRIKQVEEALDTLKTNLQNALTDAKDNKDKIKTLKQKLVTLEATIQTTETKIPEYDTAANKNIDSIKTRLKVLKELVNTAKNEKQQLEIANNEKIAKINENITKALKKAKQALDKATEVESSNDVSKLETANTQLEDAKKALGKVKEEIETNEHDENTENVEPKLNEVIEKQRQIKEKIDSLNQAEQERIRQVKQALTDAMTSLQSKLDDVKDLTKVDELEQKLPLLQAEINAAEAVHSTHNISKNILNEELKPLLKKLNDLITTSETTHSNKNSELERIKREVTKKVIDAETAVNEAVNESQAITDKNVAKITAAIEKLNQAKQTAEEAETFAEDKGYRTKKDEAHALVKKADDELLAAQEKLRQAQEDEQHRIDAVVQEIKDEIKRVNDAKQEAIDAKGNIDLSTEKIAALQELNTKAIAKHSEIQSKPENKDVFAINQELDKLKQATDAITSELGELNRVQNENKQEVEDAYNEANTAFEQAKTAITDAGENIEKLQKAVEKLNDALTKVETTLTKATTKNYSTKKAEAETLKQNIAEAISDTEAKINRIKSSIKQKLQEANRDFDTAKSIVENDFEDKTKVDEAKTKLQNAKSLATQVKQDAEAKGHASAKNDAETLLEKITDLESQVEGLLKYHEVKDYVNGLHYINNPEKSGFINELKTNKFNQTKLEEIKDKAKNRDDLFKQAREENAAKAAVLETLKNELDSNDQNQQKIIDHINSILSFSKINPNERQLAWSTIKDETKKLEDLAKIVPALKEQAQLLTFFNKLSSKLDVVTNNPTYEAKVRDFRNELNPFLEANKLEFTIPEQDIQTRKNALNSKKSEFENKANEILLGYKKENIKILLDSLKNHEIKNKINEIQSFELYSDPAYKNPLVDEYSNRKSTIDNAYTRLNNATINTINQLVEELTNFCNQTKVEFDNWLEVVKLQKQIQAKLKEKNDIFKSHASENPGFSLTNVLFKIVGDYANNIKNQVENIFKSSTKKDELSNLATKIDEIFNTQEGLWNSAKTEFDTLNEWIQKADVLNGATDFILSDSEKQEFIEALIHAKAVKNTDANVPNDYKAARENLESKYHAANGLNGMKLASRKALEDLIKDVEGRDHVIKSYMKVDEPEYITFANALQAARDVFNNHNSLKVDYDNTVTALTNAKTTISAICGNKIRIHSKIKQIKEWFTTGGARYHFDTPWFRKWFDINHIPVQSRYFSLLTNTEYNQWNWVQSYFNGKPQINSFTYQELLAKETEINNSNYNSLVTLAAQRLQRLREMWTIMITSYSIGRVLCGYSGNYDKFNAIIRNISIPQDAKTRVYRLANWYINGGGGGLSPINYFGTVYNYNYYPYIRMIRDDCWNWLMSDEGWNQMQSMRGIINEFQFQAIEVDQFFG